MRDGSTQTLHPADNPAVKGLVYLTTATRGGTTGASFTTSTFGTGRVAIWGDSSPIDDGTGQSGNTLYNGWNDPAGTDAALALNATAWLAGAGTYRRGGGGGGTGCTASQLLGNAGLRDRYGRPWTRQHQGDRQLHQGAGARPARGTPGWTATAPPPPTRSARPSPSRPAARPRRLTYWLHVDTAETTTTTKYDTLTVAVSGSTVASYSNLNAATGYQQRTVNLAGWIGQSVTVTFTGVEDASYQTSFVVDDTALSVG